MRRLWWMVLVLVVLGAAASPAFAAAAADVAVTIAPDGSVKPDPAQLTSGQTIAWKNNDNADHTVKLEDGRTILVPKSSTSDPIDVANDEDYVIDAVPTIHHIVVGASKSSSTTTTAPPTTAPPTTAPTTTAPTTTAATSTTAKTTTTSTTATTTTTLAFSSAAPLPIKDSGSGGSSAAPWLVAGTIAVAGAAGASYYLWKRSGAPVAPGPPPVEGEPPPTTQGPAV